MKFETALSAEEESVDINVIPLIDVLLVLLIFFIMSTTFTETQGISIKLPVAASSANEGAPKDLRVTITKYEKIMLGDKPVTLESLPQAFKDALGNAPGNALVLRADREVPHGLVVRVMDMARNAGIHKLAVATTQE